MLSTHMGTTFFVEGVKKKFSCVHGSFGEVLFSAATAWVRGGLIFLTVYNNCLFVHLPVLFNENGLPRTGSGILSEF